MRFQFGAFRSRLKYTSDMLPSVMLRIFQCQAEDVGPRTYEGYPLSREFDFLLRRGYG